MFPDPSWCSPCFYRTYEELKRDRESKAEWMAQGFYRTYEELKLVWSYNRRYAPGRFYRTYEELKPSQGSQKSPGVGVFIVPMRN